MFSSQDLSTFGNYALAQAMKSNSLRVALFLEAFRLDCVNSPCLSKLRQIPKDGDLDQFPHDLTHENGSSTPSGHRCPRGPLDSGDLSAPTQKGLVWNAPKGVPVVSLTPANTSMRLLAEQISRFFEIQREGRLEETSGRREEKVVRGPQARKRETKEWSKHEWLINNGQTGRYWALGTGLRQS